MRSVLSRTPLRIKLVAALLALVVIALISSGTIAATTLRSYLTGRVDTQLLSVAQHDTGANGHGGAPDGDGGADPDLPSAFVTEVTDSAGKVVYGPTSNLLDSSVPLPKLPSGAQTNLTSSTPKTFTVKAQRGDATWRAVEMPITLSNGKTGTLFVAESLGDVDGTVQHLELLLLIVGAIAVVVIAGVGYLVVRANLRTLNEVEETAERIAAGDLSQRVREGAPRTEVGRLSIALNSMLGQIEMAFAEQAASEEAARRSEDRMRESEAGARESEHRMRQFVADASHELRTPLTSIRGFAELYRQGAAADPEQLPALMRRIEDAARRMGVLVDDLLLLARMDQDRPLAQEPVDLTLVATDAVVAAQAVDPRRTISLDAPSGPVVVIGDDVRLRQVIDNLLSNALRHAPGHTPIEVSVTTYDPDSNSNTGRVVLAVRDHGPGMTVETAAHIFERFYRADPSRNRADGGSGLGLSIVSALVAGHGGTVSVETAPGEGATLRVALPLARVAYLSEVSQSLAS
jgi:two-component system OmpR family sensor kinase